MYKHCENSEEKKLESFSKTEIIQAIRYLSKYYSFQRGLEKSVIDKIEDIKREKSFNTAQKKWQKPTDIWTNHPMPNFKPTCERGAKCHVSAPRGAKTGTQGLANRIEKARIPTELCEHIVDICEV